MKFETIRFEQQDGIARVTLHRPDCGNAINVRMVEELERLFHELEDRSEARVAVVSGEGGVFCSGIDLRDFPEDGSYDVQGFARWERVCRSLERLPMATIAAIDGECAGGGLQLALACDVRLAASRSFFHLHEVRYGFLPGMGTFRLAKYIGLGRARRFALTGRRMDAAEASAIGLIDRLCDEKSMADGIMNAIEEFGPPRTEKGSLPLIRRLMDEAFEMPYEDFLGGFLAAQHLAVQSETFRTRVRRAHDSDSPQGDGNR